MEKREEILELPKFIPGGVVRETRNFRVVTDWKPGLENQVDGERFFIEPKTEMAEGMLQMAAEAHHISNFNIRKVTLGDKTIEFSCLRADFIPENLLSLLRGATEIPEEGEDTIPSPDRMEECLELHPDKYTFSN